MITTIKIVFGNATTPYRTVHEQSFHGAQRAQKFARRYCRAAGPCFYWAYVR